MKFHDEVDEQERPNGFDGLDEVSSLVLAQPVDDKDVSESASKVWNRTLTGQLISFLTDVISS